MKLLKITLVAIFSITLLTAVLPSNKTEIVNNSKKEITKQNIDLAAMINPKVIMKPSQG